jgi:thiamine pyrophosphate-dependent acetolactate synthase large subunit-like protein
MQRIDLMRRLVARLTNEAVVAGIGNTNFDLFAAQHRPLNFYMLGSMGLAFPIAFGVALAQPQRRVIGIEGDGSLLMDLGCLATIGMHAPANLTLIVIDNGSYQITGGQPTASAANADFVAIAKGAGIANSAWASDPEDFSARIARALAGPGPALIAAKVDATPAIATPDRNPTAIRDRFVGALREAAE